MVVWSLVDSKFVLRNETYLLKLFTLRNYWRKNILLSLTSDTHTHTYTCFLLQKATMMQPDTKDRVCFSTMHDVYSLRLWVSFIFHMKETVKYLCIQIGCQQNWRLSCERCWNIHQSLCAGDMGRQQTLMADYIKIQFQKCFDTIRK